MKMTESQSRRSGVAHPPLRPANGEVQGQGYIGQALGYADVLATAFSHAMTYRPEDPEWEGRDRFLLSHGHYAIAYYAALLEAELSRKRSWKPTAPTTADYRCRGWRPTRQEWRCPVVRWGRGCPLP